MSNQFSIVGVQRLTNEALYQVTTGDWVNFEMESSKALRIIANVGEEDPAESWPGIKEKLIDAYGEERLAAYLEGGFLFVLIDTTSYGGISGDPSPESSDENKNLELDYLQKRALIKALVQSEDQWVKWFCF